MMIPSSGQYPARDGRPGAAGTRRWRRGLTSTLAMLYLVLFSTLAIGFYAAVNTSVQIAGSEGSARQAMLSAESGMEYMRFLLGNISIPHSTQPSQSWTSLCSQVKAQLDNTANAGSTGVAMPSGNVMTLPTIHLNDAQSFTASLTEDGEQILVRVTGMGARSEIRRTIQMTYARAMRASAIFDYGVASKSAISMSGNAKITGANDPGRGSVLSCTDAAVPLTMIGGPSISGDFSYTNPAGQPTFGHGTIAGYQSSQQAFLDHVHAGVTPPEFPEIDTSAFEQYVPSVNAAPGPNVIAVSNPAGTEFTNIRIKANSNPKFAGGTVIKGVVFIETPNKVTFNGNATIQGAVVVQNAPTGTVATNTLTFVGNVEHKGVETLDDSYGNLRKLTGSFLLAPTFTVALQGNNNNVGGTIVSGKLDVTGNAGAKVKGTVINMEDTGVNLTGSSDIVIASTGTTNYPAGVFFGTHYTPLPDTYKELP